eukprot:scaffold1302_cov245-Pinguiococcus_pyrenoidosus.AAC.8
MSCTNIRLPPVCSHQCDHRGRRPLCRRCDALCGRQRSQRRNSRQEGCSIWQGRAPPVRGDRAGCVGQEEEEASDAEVYKAGQGVDRGTSQGRGWLHEERGLEQLLCAAGIRFSKAAEATQGAERGTAIASGKQESKGREERQGREVGRRTAEPRA